ncbi:MAG: AsmA family protein [Burkholderiales bacterium]|nr:AsmA family protein [Burkholderiales bacterium]
MRLRLAQSGKPGPPPGSLRPPLSFAIDAFRIDHLTLETDAGRLDLHHLAAALSGNRDRLRAEVKSLATRYGTVQADIGVGTRAPFALTGEIDLSSLQNGDYGATAKLGGSVVDAVAQLDARAREASASARLVLAPFDAQPLSALELQLKDFEPRAWMQASPTAMLSGEAHLAADSGRKLTGFVELTNGLPGPLDENSLPFTRLRASVRGVAANLQIEDAMLDLADAGRFTGRGGVKNGELTLALATSGLDLQGLNTRLNPTRLAGRLAFGGDVEAQRMKLELAQPGLQLRLAAALSDRVASIDEAYARAGSAELSARGHLALDAEGDFAISGRLAGFDPSRLGQYESALVNSRFELAGQFGPVLQVAAKFDLHGSRLFGLPASASGSLRSSRSDRPDVALNASLRIGDTRVSARGSVKDPARMQSMDLALRLSGRNLADLYRIVGLPLPPTPPYRIDGRLLHSGQVWELRPFAGTVGKSDLAGHFELDRGAVPQFIEADIRSKRLDLADLAGFIGANPGAGAKTAEPKAARVIPDTPYNLAKFGSASADVRFEGERVMTDRLPIDDISAHLVLRNGVLALAPLDFGVAGGRIVSDITLDGSKPVISARADMRVQSLQLGKLLPRLDLAKASVGDLAGRATLRAHGNSVAAMLGAANGSTTLVVGAGEVSDLMLRLSDLDLANALLVVLRGDRNIPIRCMVADLDWNHGVVQPRRLLLDTRHTTLTGEGTANFGDETLDLRLVARPKDNSLFALRGPIVVKGPFAHPSVRPDLGRIGARGAASVALAAIAPPLALVPFVQFGHTEDAPCASLVQAAREEIRSPAPPLPLATGQRTRKPA